MQVFEQGYLSKKTCHIFPLTLPSKTCQGKLASVNEALFGNIVGFSVNSISSIVFFSPIRTNWAFFHVFRYMMHFNIKAGKKCQFLLSYRSSEYFMTN